MFACRPQLVYAVGTFIGDILYSCVSDGRGYSQRWSKFQRHFVKYLMIFADKCERVPSRIGQVASVALLRSWVRLPVGVNFRLRLKKSSRQPTRQSTWKQIPAHPGPLSHGLRYGLRRPCVRVGQGSGVFSTCVRGLLLTLMLGGRLAPRRSSRYQMCLSSNQRNVTIIFNSHIL